MLTKVLLLLLCSGFAGSSMVLLSNSGALDRTIAEVFESDGARPGQGNVADRARRARRPAREGERRRRSREGERAPRPASRARSHGSSDDRRMPGSRFGDAWGKLGRGPGVVWRIVRLPLAAAVLLLAILLGLRWLARRERRYVRLSLLPYRADSAEPEEVRRLLESWHQLLLQRWWRRIPFGQRGIALELVMEYEQPGRPRGRLTVVCPEDLQRAVAGALLGCYRDSRLEVEPEELPSLRQLVRLKKRKSFVWALDDPHPGGPNMVDTVLSQMTSVGEAAVLQYALTPTPAVFDSYSRSRLAAAERERQSARAVNPRDPGLQSEIVNQELESALRVQHRPLFFTEIRVAAMSYAGCRAIAGVVRGESGAENRLVERRTRVLGRRSLYLRRLSTGVGNPLPSWRRGVLSSTELARLWQLPSPGLKVVPLVRSSVPRLGAPPEITRSPEHVLAHDERPTGSA
jgi:hypothetical protein